MIRTLYVIHCESNTGYAILPLEKLFLEAGLELGSNDLTNVHFCYPDTSKGMSAVFPPDFKNVLECDIHRLKPGTIERMTRYVRENKIELIVFFDIQPVHRSFKKLREAGAKTLIAYWGAPISSVSPLWKRLAKRLTIELSNSKVDSLIFETKIMAHYATHGRGVPERMIDVVPLGVDTEKFRPIKSNYVHEIFHFAPGTRVFVYSGHMEERKGVRVIVKAAIELLTSRGRDNIAFVICGNKGDESRAYEELYRDLPVGNRIQFGGYRSDLPEIYASAFCGIVASTGWDSFAFGTIEMAASGLPLIASRLQGLAEAVIDRETGILFEPGDHIMLADCIERLLDNPELAAEYGRRGRKRCESELSYSHQKRLFLQVLSRRIAASREEAS